MTNIFYFELDLRSPNAGILKCRWNENIQTNFLYNIFYLKVFIYLFNQ